MAAAPLAVPQSLLEPLTGGIFVGKHVVQLDERDTFAVGFARCLVSLHHGHMVHCFMVFVNLKS